MNISQNMHVNGICSNDSPSSVCQPAIGNAGTAPRDAIPAADVSWERLHQYVTHLEGLLLSNHCEASELLRIIEARDEEVRRKQLEHERILIHQARHAAMGEMLSLIAHKWRQPLNAISLSVQNMKEAWEFGELNDELMDRATFRVMEQVKLLSQTIDNFRNYITPPDSAEHFNPILCVKGLVPLLSTVFSDFTSIELRDSNAIEDDIQVAGSLDAFQQVIHNLLSNANDAVQEQKRRSGAAFCGAITISCMQEADDIIITIADNGGGITESITGRIFDPFFTTKQYNSGLGIGLYLSKIIIEYNMNGSLWFENIFEGACFTIRIPALTGGRMPV